MVRSLAAGFAAEEPEMKVTLQREEATAGDTVVSVLSPWQAEPLLALFESVARQEGWQPGGQIRAYRKHSVYFAASVGEELAGGLHLVLGGTDVLPVLTVWPELCLQRRKDVADVALVAVTPQFRVRHDLLWQLFLTMWRWCADNDIAELWAEVPVENLPLYNRLGWNLRVAGPERLHWGEPCYPCRVGIRELADDFARRARTSAAYRRRLEQAQETPAATDAMQEHGKESSA